MQQPQQAIDWIRWLLYLMGGLPLAGWLFLTRDRALRLVAVLGIAFFVQDALAGRRYFWAFSLEPSVMCAYVALAACILDRGRLPRLGIYGPLWMGLLFCAGLSAILGSRGGALDVNVKYYQMGFLNALVFFLYGVGALRTHRELRRFWEWFIYICLLLVVAHFFSMATGYRFRGSSTGTELGSGGVLDNTNTLGSFYAAGLPVVLTLVLAGKLRPTLRLVAYAAIAGMLGSLLLTGCRAGMLFAPFTCAVALFMSRIGVRRAVAISVTMAILGGLGFVVMKVVASGSWGAVRDQLVEQGAQTDRWETFAGYGVVVLRRPLGVGLSPVDTKGLQHLTGALSAHNIYLDMALESGLLGLGIFLWICARIVLTTRFALRTTRDPDAWLGLLCAFVATVGFLGVGIFQPILNPSVGTKMLQCFWLIAGLNVGAADRVLAERRAAIERELQPLGAGLALPAHPERV